jgi:hypothetical protein
MTRCEDDLYAWAREQERAIRNGDWSSVDRVFVANEIGGIALQLRSDLLTNLTEKARVVAQGPGILQYDIASFLEGSPSLQHELPRLIRDAVKEAFQYPDAHKRTPRKTESMLSNWLKSRTPTYHFE